MSAYTYSIFRRLGNSRPAEWASVGGYQEVSLGKINRLQTQKDPAFLDGVQVRRSDGKIIEADIYGYEDEE